MAKKVIKKVRPVGIPPTETQKKRIRAMMKRAGIRNAAAAAGVSPDIYQNVMAGRSKNMTEFNKLMLAAKKLIEQSEQLAM